jgi:hypothetical protein
MRDAVQVVVLEELAGEFGMKTQDAIDRVTKLEAMGRITGVIDDRGKFVFITPEEMSKVGGGCVRGGGVGTYHLSISVAATVMTLPLRPS